MKLTWKVSLTCNQDTSSEGPQIRRASIWPINEGWDGTGPIMSSTISQLKGETWSSCDEEHHVTFLDVSVRSRNTSNCERVWFNWEVADQWKYDVGMLSWCPHEAVEQSEVHHVLCQEFNSGIWEVQVFVTPTSVVIDNVSKTKKPVQCPNYQCRPNISTMSVITFWISSSMFIYPYSLLLVCMEITTDQKNSTDGRLAYG